MQQVVEALGVPVRDASADEPTLRGAGSVAQSWEAAPLEAAEAGPDGAVRVLDESQKVPGWPKAGKRLWDEDTRAGRLAVVRPAPVRMRLVTAREAGNRRHRPPQGHSARFDRLPTA
jgi:hypothetical protein